MKPTLWIDTKAGISADRFAAALIGLGAPERGLIQAIKSAGEELGMLDAHIHLEFLPAHAPPLCLIRGAQNGISEIQDLRIYA